MVNFIWKCTIGTVSIGPFGPAMLYYLAPLQFTRDSSPPLLSVLRYNKAGVRELAGQR